MAVLITERLTRSIECLEESIDDVYNNLDLKGQLSTQLRERLVSYKKICKMQLRFTSQIRQQLQAENFHEVTRLTNLINGLSAMILDDVRSIISSLAGQTQAAPQYN